MKPAAGEGRAVGVVLGGHPLGRRLRWFKYTQQEWVFGLHFDNCLHLCDSSHFSGKVCFEVVNVKFNLKFSCYQIKIKKFIFKLVTNLIPQLENSPRTLSVLIL